MRYLLTVLFIAVSSYSFIGTDGNVEEIKKRAALEMLDRNWKILRYEGYEYGSWGNHGGKVWYHVEDLGHRNTYYRVYLTLWDGEVHFYYGKPEVLNRINIDNK